MNTREITEQAVFEMLTESTGSHFLDSGGAYGRHWERNQLYTIEDFRKRPSATVEFHHYGKQKGYVHEKWDLSELSINIFHFLVSALEFDEDMDNHFLEWCKQPENEHLSYLGSIEPYLKHLETCTDIGDFEGENPQIEHGPYGECTSPFIVNTYNHDSLLSQVVQYALFRIDDRDAVLLSIHNGCDVRGGYTCPRFFWLETGCTEYMLLDDNRISICCENYDHNHVWDMDGYNYFTFQGEHGISYNESLPFDHETKRKLTNHGIVHNLEEYDASDSPGDKGKGYIYIDDHGNGYCPLCGERLTAYFMFA